MYTYHLIGTALVVKRALTREESGHNLCAWDSRYSQSENTVEWKLFFKKQFYICTFKTNLHTSHYFYKRKKHSRRKNNFRLRIHNVGQTNVCSLLVHMRTLFTAVHYVSIAILAQVSQVQNLDLSPCEYIIFYYK